MSYKISLFNTTINNHAILNANEVLKSTYISAGNLADLFENKLNAKYNFKYSISVNSGTAALFLALKAAGITHGDNVLLAPQTFIATGHAILQCGATPIFCDINLDGNISIESIKSKLLEYKIKAIMPVHWAGYPCDMDEINTIAAANNIMVIDDAAHALGAKYKNKYIGNCSDFTAFSFQAIKHLTTGDGGLITCNNVEDANLIKKLRWFDIDRNLTVPSILGEREYDATEIGYKLHMNDLAASIGLGNLLTLDFKMKKIKSIANLYRTKLNDVPGLKLLDYKSDRESAYWLFPILVENRLDFINKMNSYEIPVSVIHLGIDKNTLFGGLNESLINQRYFDANQIHIPIHDGLEDDQVEFIISTIKSGW